MVSASLFARLQLRPDASVADIRRAYARELKKIDQETQPEAFQQLREIYEQLMSWAQRRQNAQDASEREAAHNPVAARVQLESGQAESAHIEPLRADRAEVRNDNAGSPAQGSAAQVFKPTQAAPEQAQVSPEALGREVLERVVRRLTQTPFADHDDAAACLAECLQDARLQNVDARSYFEWGIASILASGWRPGHELLFGPAINCFGWHADRSRLLRFGHAGHVVDNAVSELLAFDSQSPQARALQRDVIRELRSGARPATAQLLKNLPVAEYVVGTFPNWLHVIARPESLRAWREWEAEVPQWRRKIARAPRVGLAKAAAVAQPAARSAGFGWNVIMVIVVLSAFARMAENSTRAPDPAPRPLSRAAEFGPRPVLASHTDSAALPIDNAAAFVKDSDPGLAQWRAADLAKGKADPQRCEDASRLAQSNPATHQHGGLGQPFDRLIMDCMVKKMSWLPTTVIDPSYKREHDRKRMLGTAQMLAERPATVGAAARLKASSPAADQARSALPGGSGQPESGLKYEVPAIQLVPEIGKPEK